MNKFFNLYKWVTALLLVLCGTMAHAQTADLTAHQPAAIPSGYTFEWHTGPLSSSPLVSNPALAATGVYYAFYKDSTGCYSQPSPIRITTNPCPLPSIDLRTAVDSTQKPVGSIVSFYTGIPVSVSNKLAGPVVSASGTYYSAYFDTTTGCYSNSSPIVAIKQTCFMPDLTPVIQLGDNSFTTGTTKEFVVEIDEINNVATANGAAAFRLTVPVGYQLSAYNTAETVANPAGLGPVSVNNSQWQVVGTPSATAINLRMVPGANIAAGGYIKLGFTITRTDKGGTNTGNIVANIFADPTNAYDSNVTNNIFVRILAGL